MRRVLALFVLLGFLSATFAVAAHRHVTTDDTTFQAACKFCSQGDVPVVPRENSSPLRPLEVSRLGEPLLPICLEPVFPRILDLSPNHSPPAV